MKNKTHWILWWLLLLGASSAALGQVQGAGIYLSSINDRAVLLTYLGDEAWNIRGLDESGRIVDLGYVWDNDISDWMDSHLGPDYLFAGDDTVAAPGLDAAHVTVTPPSGGPVRVGYGLVREGNETRFTGYIDGIPIEGNFAGPANFETNLGAFVGALADYRDNGGKLSSEAIDSLDRLFNDVSQMAYGGILREDATVRRY